MKLGRFPLLIAVLLLAACNNVTDNNRAAETQSGETVPIGNSVTSSNAPANNNFAVLITYKPQDKASIANEIGAQMEQLDNWWKAGYIENIYYQSAVQVKGTDSLPVVSFFIRAADEFGARSILDDAVMVKRGYATYELRPVGQLVRQRPAAAADVALKKGHVFVVVYDSKDNWKSLPAGVSKEQELQDSVLHVKGIIENQYLDREASTNKYTAVYFINAASKKEAQDLIAAMPVVKGGNASYKIREVGSFMKGRVQ
jgi:hypothetical protein